MLKFNYFPSLTGFLAAFILLYSGCITTDTAYTRVAPGIWRGILTLEKPQLPAGPKDSVVITYAQIRDGEMPFNFEVVYLDDTRFVIDFINGDERIRCDSIQYGRDRTTARDTMNVYFPEYQSYLHAEVRGDGMQGYWCVTTKTNYRVPFFADAGRNYRFTSLNEKPVADLTGEWATLFGVNEPEQDRAVGEFKQTGNRLTGTFRTESGDYRFLEGTVQGRKFWLSCFDGSHAFLFAGSIQGDSLQGEFRSGKHYQTLWTAWRDPNFHLGDADSLTSVVPGKEIAFSLPAAGGGTVTYPGPAFDQKIRILTISGTWCPNCLDEQRFLTEYLQKNQQLAEKISVVTLSFERHKDPAQALAHLDTYRKRLKIPYNMVYAGPADSKDAQRVLPVLSKVMAFPTMIIADKQGKIRKVHTGFDGPATSKYADFQEKFHQLITQLAAE